MKKLKNRLSDWRVCLQMKTPQPIADFWLDDEAKITEHVIAFSLGRYIRGWPEFHYPLWGLVIATDGGFRFHHFPNEGWIGAMSRAASGKEAPKEQTIYIPKDRLISSEFTQETSWWKRLIFDRQPTLRVCYRNGNGEKEELLVEVTKEAAAVAEALKCR
jgi:hypothetical protein